MHSRYIKKKAGNRATIHSIKGAGHACNFDQADAFNPIVKRWMDKHVLLLGIALPENNDVKLST